MNHGLVAAMAEAGETAESLAARVGVDPKTAQRWVRPGRVPRPRHRAQLAAVLKRDVADLWPDVLKRREPAWFRPWADIEHEAVALRAFELVWVPGLFQTEAYARATLAGEALTPEEVDELVAARLQRQAILRRPRPPQVVAVLDEAILRRPVQGDATLMREQCARIVACAELPAVQVHVVPADTGMYPGFGGPFVIAESPDGTRVAHVDGQVRAQIIDDHADVATLERRWARIVGEALPRARSLDLIRKAAASWT
ncbi:Scr1 family TA system antitoxin-like transcriptional regulator [Micromonospora sp. GCM10011542]|uniref:Scr1 family TA system antitoxin-like transcriptional regulator n=1 Tax=Micromonospora sp. GCM10011542 TaxID=3317337 RepID=UPI00361A3A8D